METGTRLTVRAYHISSLEYGEENRVTLDGHMTVCPSVAEKIREKEPLIKDISIRIIRPDEHDQHTNTVMDVIPLSAKVLGKVGEGITHTLTGVYVILTGVDEAGRQVCNFGASDGILRDKIAWGGPARSGGDPQSLRCVLPDLPGTDEEIQRVQVHGKARVPGDL